MQGNPRHVVTGFAFGARIAHEYVVDPARVQTGGACECLFEVASVSAAHWGTDYRDENRL